MDRRSFLNWVGVDLLANSLLVALVACSAKSREVSNGEFQEIGTVAELVKNGQILNQQNAHSPVLVVQDS